MTQLERERHLYELEERKQEQALKRAAEDYARQKQKAAEESGEESEDESEEGEVSSSDEEFRKPVVSRQKAARRGALDDLKRRRAGGLTSQLDDDEDYNEMDEAPEYFQPGELGGFESVGRVRPQVKELTQRTPLTLKALNDSLLNRRTFERMHREPYFEDFIKGMFVRMSVGQVRFFAFVACVLWFVLCGLSAVALSCRVFEVTFRCCSTGTRSHDGHHDEFVHSRHRRQHRASEKQTKRSLPLRIPRQFRPADRHRHQSLPRQAQARVSHGYRLQLACDPRRARTMGATLQPRRCVHAQL